MPDSKPLDLEGDDYEYESVRNDTEELLPSLKSKQKTRRSTTPTLDGTVGYAIAALDIDEQIQKTIERHDISEDDPIREIFDIVKNLTSATSNFEKHIREILDNYGDNLNDRISQTIRTETKQSRQEAKNTLDLLKVASEKLDDACSSLGYLTDRSTIDSIIDGVSKANPNQKLVEQIAQVGKNDGETLSKILNRFDEIESPAIQTHIQQIPREFYLFGAAIAAISIAAAGFTWKSVENRVALADWINSPDGKLAH